jgi:hypothetical protein
MGSLGPLLLDIAPFTEQTGYRTRNFASRDGPHSVGERLKNQPEAFGARRDALIPTNVGHP